MLCVGNPESKGPSRGPVTRGRIDGTGQRRPMYVVAKTHLQNSHGQKWQGGRAKSHPCRHAMTGHDMLERNNMT